MTACTCARCQPRCNGLPLERWREMMTCATNPFHFYQLASTKLPLRTQCSGLVREYKYQGGGKVAGRDEIRDALAEAERKLAKQLGYPVTPTWLCEEVAWPRNQYGAHTPDIKLNTRKLIAIGQEVVTKLADVTVQLIDQDGDTCKETFLLQIPLASLPADLDVDEIGVYFGADDQWSPTLDFCEYEVRPINAIKRGLNLEIYGKSWLIVRPLLYQGFAPQGLNDAYWLNIDDALNYAQTLSVYRRTIDHCQAGNGIWTATAGCSCQTVLATDCPVTCSHCAAMNFCIVDGEQGVIRPFWNGCTCGNRPDRINVSFLAGDCTEDWSSIIAQLACAELGCCICDCGDSCMDYWAEDIGMKPMDEKGTKSTLRQELLNNPWGSTRRGSIYAWEAITRDGGGVSAYFF